MKTNLVEATGPQSGISGSRWNAKIISEGRGSSGYYLEGTLRDHGPKAWPNGTHIYFNHLGKSEREERNGSHDVRDLVGVIEGDPEFNESDKGLYAKIKFFPEHKEMMEQIAPYVGLSIEAGGELDEDGNVIALYESPLNAVSVVPRAGAGGQLVSLIESFQESGRIALSEKEVPDGTSEVPERKPMTPEEITSLAEALGKALEPKFSALTEAIKPVEPETVPDETDFAAVVEAAVEADLSKTSRARVVEAVKGGKSLDEALTAEKTIRDEILAESADVLAGNTQVTGGTPAGYTVGGWK